MMGRALIAAGIVVSALVAAILVRCPDMRRQWGLWLVNRFADFRGSEKAVPAGRGATAPGPDGRPPIPGAGTAVDARYELTKRLEEQILTKLSKAMPINLYYAASDPDCVAMAEKLWKFLGDNGFSRSEYSGALKPGQTAGLHITIKAESYDMTIAPPAYAGRH